MNDKIIIKIIGAFTIVILELIFLIRAFRTDRIGREGRYIYRKENPRAFWWRLVLNFWIMGLCLLIILWAGK